MTKLNQANEILNADTYEQQRDSLRHFQLFFPSGATTPYWPQGVGEIEYVENFYSLLRQRAFEYSMNYRLAKLEEQIGNGRNDQ